MSCGTPLPPQTYSQSFTPTDAPHYYQQPKSGLSSAQILIIAVVLVVILVVGAVAAAFVFYAPFSLISRVSSTPGPVEVAGLFLAIIYPNYASDGYFGPAYRYLGFPGPMYFQRGQIFQSKFTLTLQGAESHSIDSTTLGFFRRIHPALPHSDSAPHHGTRVRDNIHSHTPSPERRLQRKRDY